jgi:preprotein translocase subunit SecE
MRQILRRQPQSATTQTRAKARKATKVQPRRNRTVQFFSEIRAEARKVTRPSREQTMKLTVLVTIVSIVVGLILGAVDYVFDQLFEVILGVGRL